MFHKLWCIQIYCYSSRNIELMLGQDGPQKYRNASIEVGCYLPIATGRALHRIIAIKDLLFASRWCTCATDLSYS